MIKNTGFQQTKFLISAAAPKQYPTDSGAEVAFVGRSNAGKSTALNTITAIKNLARTSKTPGCTQLLNFFTVNEKKTYRLVDLPGYGFANVPAAVQKSWQENLETYLTTRKCLKGLVLISDIRHALTPLDWQMIDWAQQYHLPIHILLTKADKLALSQAKNTLQRIQASLAHLKILPSIQLFSATKGLGLKEARNQIKNWLQEKNDCKPNNESNTNSMEENN